MKWIDAYAGRLRLIGLVVLAPLLIWWLALSRTVTLWKDYRAATERLQKLETDGGTVAVSPQVTASPVISNGKILEQLMAVVTDNHLSIVAYSPLFTSAEGEWKIYTGELELAGEYIPLLKAVDYIGQHKEWGRIRSVRFRTVADRIRHTQQLRMNLWIQQIEKQQP